MEDVQGGNAVQHRHPQEAGKRILPRMCGALFPDRDCDVGEWSGGGWDWRSSKNNGRR